MKSKNTHPPKDIDLLIEELLRPTKDSDSPEQIKDLTNIMEVFFARSQLSTHITNRYHRFIISAMVFHHCYPDFTLNNSLKIIKTFIGEAANFFFEMNLKTLAKDIKDEYLKKCPNSKNNFDYLTDILRNELQSVFKKNPHWILVIRITHTRKQLAKKIANTDLSKQSVSRLIFNFSSPAHHVMCSFISKKTIELYLENIPFSELHKYDERTCNMRQNHLYNHLQTMIPIKMILDEQTKLSLALHLSKSNLTSESITEIIKTDLLEEKSESDDKKDQRPTNDAFRKISLLNNFANFDKIDELPLLDFDVVTNQIK